MLIRTDATGTLEALGDMLDEFSNHPQVEAVGILTCDENGFDEQALTDAVSRCTKPLFGGVFPALISGGNRLQRGTIVIGLTLPVRIHRIAGMSDPSTDFEKAVEVCMETCTDLRTMVVLVDGLSTRIAAFIEALYAYSGLEINYVGGGAGSLSLEPTPCLITNDGLLQDSALLVELSIESGVGVSHGWQSVQGPFKVTESEQNRIITLDWKPAFKVYRNVVEGHSGQRINRKNFFDAAKAYPFGISRMGAETIVRDPIALGPANSLICVGEVPQGSYVDILHGNEDSLTAAAGRALRRAREYLGKSDGDHNCLFIDCISRVLFLEDAFERELEQVAEGCANVIGACSLGEIANSGRDYLEFYNKTAVVALLEDE